MGTGSMRGRTTTSQISYKEVDSVSEGSASSADEEDHQHSPASKVNKRRRKKSRKGSAGDTYGTGTNKKKRRRLSQEGEGTGDPGHADEEEVDPRALEAEMAANSYFSDQLLLKLPYEMLAEICKYLDLGDIVHLAKVSPALNAALLARSARPIWTASRKQSGYRTVPPDMDEVDFALVMEGTLCQMLLGPDLHLSRYVIEDVQRVQSELQAHATADADAHATLSSRVAPGTSEMTTPTNVETYMNARKTSVTQWHKLCDQIDHSRSVLWVVEDDESSARVEWEEKMWKERAPSVLLQLIERHEWSPREAADLELCMTKKWYHRAPRELLVLPKGPPDEMPLLWKRFRRALSSSINRLDATWNARSNRASEDRRDILEVWYKSSNTIPEIARDLSIYPQDVPSWWDFEKQQEQQIRKVCELPTAVLQMKTPEEYRDIFKAGIIAMRERDRVTMIRCILAAQLDTPVSKLSRKVSDYPIDKYLQEYFERIANRCWTSDGALDTYRAAMRSGQTAKQVARGTKPAWRRATAHVMRAANVKETETSMMKLDALGAGFKWENGPRGYKGRSFSWIKMVDILVKKGPKDLHLNELEKIQIVYRRPKKISAPKPTRKSMAIETFNEPEPATTTEATDSTAGSNTSTSAPTPSAPSTPARIGTRILRSHHKKL
ncbi:hypothetical protein JCM10908_002570 [Rhodotorula pacifica]|uniref:F-box protein n=1 Tax=Rhodotorula pacifica TaxID=1495444 RepID=UPI00317452C8